MKECEWLRQGPGWKENEEFTLRGELGTRRPEDVSEAKEVVSFQLFSESSFVTWSWENGSSFF